MGQMEFQKHDRCEVGEEALAEDQEPVLNNKSFDFFRVFKKR